MNERIKELMKGCFDVTVDSRGREECTADFINVQKFADLIIKECVEIVETQQVPIRPSPSGEIAARWAMDALRECRDEIKEHFGVK
jgi:hypothetical protein